MSDIRCSRANFLGTGVASSTRLWQIMSQTWHTGQAHQSPRYLRTCGKLTSSAASACTIANSIKRAISSLFPVIARRPLSNRLRAILPSAPLRVRSFSESSAESEEYSSALPWAMGSVDVAIRGIRARPTSSVNASGGGEGRRYRGFRQS